MAKTKKNRSQKFYLSEKQLEKIKQGVTKEATARAMLLCVAAMTEHLHLTDDEICSTAETIDRWSGFIDQKLLKLNEVSEIIKKETGIDFGGF